MLVATTAHLLDEHPEVTVRDSKLAARVVVTTIESLVHRMIAAPEPTDPQSVEDEIVMLLAGYLRARETNAGDR